MNPDSQWEDRDVWGNLALQNIKRTDVAKAVFLYVTLVIT